MANAQLDDVKDKTTLSHQAYELGISDSPNAVSELVKMLSSDEKNARRLAASAIGKHIDHVVDKHSVITQLVRLATTDDGPQVRQYALKAILLFGAHARPFVGELKKVVSNPIEKEYNRELAHKILSTFGETAETGRGETKIQSQNLQCQGKSVGFADIVRNPKEYVKGEQYLAWTYKTTSPFMIKGGAGSGKTIVAMLRSMYAKRIAEENMLEPVKRVYFLTYDKLLSDEVRSCLGDKGVDVRTIDSWVYQFLKRIGYAFKRLPVDRELFLRQRDCFAVAHRRVFRDGDTRAIAKKQKSFYDEEIAWIKGRGIKTEAEYLSVERSGRGGAARMGEDDRRSFWQFKSAYDAEMARANLETFEDRVLAAYDMAVVGGIPEEFRCNHVVVDEAQDFTYVKLKLVSLMAGGDTPETKGITIVADAAQTIYQSGFSWKDANIAVAGRTKIFKRNYRNTKQIAAAAYSLMTHEEQRDEMTEMELPTNEGAIPEVWVGDKEKLLSRMLLFAKNCPLKSTRVVSAYSREEIKELEKFFEAHGFSVNTSQRIGSSGVKFGSIGSPPNGLIHLRTLHHMKGLQFDHVFLWNISEGRFPRFVDADKDLSTFRKLLYVGMTRACSTLTICAEHAIANLIGEIDPGLYALKGVN